MNISDRLYEYTMNIFDCFMTVFDRFKTSASKNGLQAVIYGQKQSNMLCNGEGQERLTPRNVPDRTSNLISFNCWLLIFIAILNFTNSLNYRYTVAILVTFAIILSHRQFSESG